MKHRFELGAPSWSQLFTLVNPADQERAEPRIRQFDLNYLRGLRLDLKQWAVERCGSVDCTLGDVSLKRTDPWIVVADVDCQADVCPLAASCQQLEVMLPRDEIIRRMPSDALPADQIND